MRILTLAGLTPKTSRHTRTHVVAAIQLAILLVASVTSRPAPATESPLFAPQTSYGTGNAPFSVAIGDLNGDGKPDLAVANAFGYAVSVLLGNGDGSFRARVDYEAGIGPHSVAIGDLNSDGKPDLAVANALSSAHATVSVLLGAGDGTFAASTAFESGHTPVAVAIGDLNGDDKLDLAVANYGYYPDDAGSVSVLLGNGDGSFGAKRGYRTGDYPNSVGMGDFNSDGRLDLAVANYGVSTVSVLLGNVDGDFDVTSFGAGHYPYSIAIGDLNGDGRSDLAIANNSPGVNSVSALLGNGDGSFAAATDFGAGTYPEFVAIGDLNGDGKSDLAVVNSGYYPDDIGSVSVLLGNGAGSFGGKTDYVAEDRPGSLAIGDLNDDGRSDLVVTNQYSNTVSVLLNIGDGCALAPMSLDISPSTINLQSTGLWVTAMLEPEPPASPTEIDVSSIRLNGSVPVDASAPTSIGDVDADGRPDLTVKFNRAAVDPTLEEGDSVTVTVTGEIGDGCFEATDVIRVIRARVEAPSGGSVVQAGSQTEVSWVTPARVDVQWVALLSSSDGGASWTLEARDLPNTGSYVWNVPSATTAHARVAVVLVESSDESGIEVKGVLGMSDPFVIASLLDADGGSVGLALHGAVPNPSRSLNVSFTLPDASPATLVVYDVSGREVSRREVGGLGVGRHVVRLSTPQTLATGVYLIHLKHGDRRLTVRAAIIR